MIGRFETLADGEWTDLPDKEMCCDCGLVHRIEYRRRGAKIQARFTRDNKGTANARRRKGLIARVAK